MGIIRGILFSFAIVLAAAGCAKDKTQKDYQDEEALNDLARYQAVQGRYSGVIKNQEDERPLGGLELILTARLNSQSSGGSSGGSSGAPSSGATAAKATLYTELHFQDRQFANIASNGGYYDPDSGIYQADFTINEINSSTGTATRSYQISLTGNIADGHIRGTMQGVGFASQTAEFDIQLNGRPLGDLAKAAKPVPGSTVEGEVITYPAKFRWDKSSPLQDIEMHAYYPVTNGVGHFVDLFLPPTDKILQMDIKFSEDLDVLFTAAHWDSQAGNITAMEQISNPSTGTVTRNLTCRNFYFAETHSKFTCMFWTNRTSAVSITFSPPVADAK